MYLGLSKKWRPKFAKWWLSGKPWDFEVLNFPTLSGWWLTYSSEKYELLVCWDDDIPNIWKKWLLVWYGQILVCWDDYSKPPTSSQYVVAAMFDMSRPKSEHDFLIQFWGWDMAKIQKTQLDTAATIISIGIYIYIHIKIYLYLYIYMYTYT